VPPADTAAAVDEALMGLEGGDDPDDPARSVEVEPETQPSMPPATRATLSAKLRPPAPPELRPPAASKPVAAKSGNHSEPEIQIEELVELIAGSEEDAEPSVTLSLDEVDDSAGRARSESEGTITLAVDDTSEGVSVKPLVAADSAPPKKPKRPPTDSPK
jgi:hypothetical protein